MNKQFLKNAETGKNQWWRYVLTVVAVIMGVGLTSFVVNQLFSTFKSVFPDNSFGKNLGVFILIGTVFGAALLVFVIITKKLHNRSFLSFVNLYTRFNWTFYLKGFLVWGTLLSLGCLITDSHLFQTFISNFSLAHFLLLFVLGFVAIGIQSFFEEILIRGYFLQGMYLRIKNINILVLINTVIFAVLHLGYGIDSLIGSFSFGIAFALIVIKQNRIEFAAGAHNANNLLLALVFLDINEATNAEFSWAINWLEMAIQLLITLAFLGIVYKYFKK